ncbi:hypothetical protein NKOR_03625 [Candidatus Nitrosopumilus koreensis AR1]|uniref:Uncharacterized protein n=1 Tax=Candidatus Nitrosopumilus koreensis AR1 TaxID=1229908 RepID=K0B584_9ARCH|nr:MULTISPECIES: hypothetical protein [Nitrosopumilus]AFS80619.1 hypothetical protein NKOR_03625 [Candidatus Nitrosopumilus koreensis AR1]
MVKLVLPPHLQDKIFEIKYVDDGVSKITSYFPLTSSEKQEIISIMNMDFSGFHSIFTDTVSEEEWNQTKEQIKKRFNDELFDIDKKL